MRVHWSHNGDRYRLSDDERTSLTEHLSHHSLDERKVISVCVNAHPDRDDVRMMIVHGTDQEAKSFTLSFIAGRTPSGGDILR